MQDMLILKTQQIMQSLLNQADDDGSHDGQGLDPGPQYNDDRTFGSDSHQGSEDDSSDLDFYHFYEPEKSSEYGYSYGNGPPHRGYGFHLGQNGHQRSSQEFGDIFGGKPKPAQPDIIPGF